MTVDGYIAALPPQARAVAQTVRSAVHAAAPDATEAIKYGMPVFRIGERYIFYLGAWKRHAGIYPVPRHYDIEDEIAPYRSGKDTVRFLYSKPVPTDLVTRIVVEKLERILKSATHFSD